MDGAERGREPARPGAMQHEPDERRPEQAAEPPHDREARVAGHQRRTLEGRSEFDERQRADAVGGRTPD